MLALSPIALEAGSGFWGFGFGALAFVVQGLRAFGVQGLGFRAEGLGVRFFVVWGVWELLPYEDLCLCDDILTFHSVGCFANWAALEVSRPPQPSRGDSGNLGRARQKEHGFSNPQIKSSHR